MAEITFEENAITLDDLLRMRGDIRVEIINGEIKEMAAAGVQHGFIAINIQRVLDPYVVAHDIGAVLPDGVTYLMFSPTRNLKDSFMPDVSFIYKENLPADFDISKPHPGIPDFAVEVFSPGDDADDIQTKVRTYLEKGTVQVLVAYPKAREVHQYRREQPEISRIYRAGKIDLEELFPGIELSVETVFALPAWAQKQAKATIE